MPGQGYTITDEQRAKLRALGMSLGRTISIPRTTEDAAALIDLLEDKPRPPVQPEYIRMGTVASKPRPRSPRTTASPSRCKLCGGAISGSKCAQCGVAAQTTDVRLPGPSRYPGRDWLNDKKK